MIAVLALLNAVVAWRVLHVRLGDKRAWAWGAACWGLELLAPFGDRLFFPLLRVNGWAELVLMLDWLSYLSLGLLSCAVVYGLVVDAALIWRRQPRSFDPGRRALFTVGGASAGTMGLGVHQALDGPQVVKVDVTIAGLPAAFDGFRVVQISDLHVGPMIHRDYVQRVVDLTMALSADAIMLTGDMVDGSPAGLADDLQPLCQLSAPAGVFYVPGNHEYYWGAEPWIEAFGRMGFVPLINDHRVISRCDSHLAVAGIADIAAGRFPNTPQPDLEAALAGLAAGTTTILLAHQPNAYELAEKHDVHLQLSGHTHGGQYVPFNVIGLFMRYFKGLYRHDNGMWIYVNAGTGFWGPPLRTGNPAEVTLLILRRG